MVYSTLRALLVISSGFLSLIPGFSVQGGVNTLTGYRLVRFGNWLVEIRKLGGRICQKYQYSSRRSTCRGWVSFGRPLILLYKRRGWRLIVWKPVWLYYLRLLISRGAGYSTLLIYGLKPLLLLGIPRFSKGLYCIFTVPRYSLKICVFRRSLRCRR